MKAGELAVDQEDNWRKIPITLIDPDWVRTFGFHALIAFRIHSTAEQALSGDCEAQFLSAWIITLVDLFLSASPTICERGCSLDECLLLITGVVRG
jgi:hypothetical protein